jgi:hypothetical protein
MNIPRRFIRALTPAAVAITLAQDAPAQLQQRLAFTGGAWFNVQVNFRNLGAFPSAGDPGPALGGAINRDYEDGFNRVDATGNDGNTTANWRYQDAAQVREGTLVMSSRSSGGGASIEDTGDDILPSGNLQYRGSLGSAGECEWGVLLGVGYAHLEADSSESLRADATLLEDTFSLAGTLPGDLPPAPYVGSPDAQGARIGSVPTRTTSTIPGGLTISGQREFEADIVPFTAGLYLECPLTGELSAVIGAGAIAAWIDGSFSYSEVNIIGSSAPFTSQGSRSESDFIFGGFVELGLDWRIWEKASLVLSGRWQPMESFELEANERRAEVEFDSSFAAYAGLALHF